MECREKRILIIDDEAAIRKSVADYLEDTGNYPVTASNGKEGLELFAQKGADAIILDMNMPEMNGFEFLERFAKSNPDIPVIMLSGVGIIDRALQSIRKGAWDFVTKPLTSFEILSHSLEQVLERARLKKENRRYREHLEDEVKIKTAEIAKLAEVLISTQKEIILTLGEVVETRSHETARHVHRVAEYAYLISKKIGLDETYASDMRIASPMHDVGKIGIPDEILNKKGSLTTEEFTIMKTHTVIGWNIFSASKLPVIQLAAELALSHHERWDGKGYPNGIAGEAIPISARITALVDVFDAITHARVYKPAWDIPASLEYLEQNAGLMFDPSLVAVFRENFDQIMEIHRLYPD